MFNQLQLAQKKTRSFERVFITRINYSPRLNTMDVTVTSSPPILMVRP